jgi:hypothetical protein
LSESRQPGAVQRDLQIKAEASYVISVKDPFMPSEIELEKKLTYPEELRAKFDGHGRIRCAATTYLDYLWTQILLIGGTTDVRGDLGFTLDAGKQNERAEDAIRSLRDLAA